MSERPRLSNDELDARYERDGYVVVRGAAASIVRPLLSTHRRLVGKTPAGFHSTPYFQDLELKRAVHRELTAALSPVVDELVTGHRVLLSSFISKRRGADGVMPPHQDWTFVDEPDASSMNFWVPLVDVDRRNGALSVLPGGQRVPPNIRGSGTDNSFARVEQFAAGRMVELEMSAGDVVIHDHRLLHASPPNTRRRPRVVAGCALVPADVPALHYRQIAPGRLEKFELEDRFFTDHTYGDPTFPPSARLLGTVEHHNPVFDEADLLALAGPVAPVEDG